MPPSRIAPGVFSSSRQVMPRCGGSASGSVFTSSAIRPARSPLACQRFSPVTTHSSPSRTARVRMACTSEPQCGSVIENAARSSPLARRGSRRERCSSVPKRSSIEETMKCVLRIPATLIQPRAISSIARQ